MKPQYHELEAMVAMIDEPNRTACERLLADHGELFRRAPGSSYNHQAWAGGYRDHITEAMNLWLLLFGSFEATGRLAQLKPEEQFTRSDGLLVLFWHDIEKPWCHVLDGGSWAADKAARKQFAARKIEEYGLVLTPALSNAFDYVEGIRDVDYSPHDRRMLPLAALCHTCDLLSARLFYDFPLAEGDAWGALRADR